MLSRVNEAVGRPKLLKPRNEVQVKKFIAIVFSLALLAWPGGFGSIALSGELPTVEEQDVVDLGQYQVILVSGVSAKRLFAKYGTMVLIDQAQRLIVLLQFEA